ncbi:MAG: salicylate esterase, partial [uncultured Thermomicrobiales bacterium]
EHVRPGAWGGFRGLELAEGHPAAARRGAPGLHADPHGVRRARAPQSRRYRPGDAHPRRGRDVAVGGTVRGCPRRAQLRRECHHRRRGVGARSPRPARVSRRQCAARWRVDGGPDGPGPADLPRARRRPRRAVVAARSRLPRSPGRGSAGHPGVAGTDGGAGPAHGGRSRLAGAQLRAPSRPDLPGPGAPAPPRRTGPAANLHLLHPHRRPLRRVRRARADRTRLALPGAGERPRRADDGPRRPRGHAARPARAGGM